MLTTKNNVDNMNNPVLKDKALLKDTLLVLVGSSSIHTHRFLTSISIYFNHIVFITNSPSVNYTYPKNITVYEIDFSFKNLAAKLQIGKILRNSTKLLPATFNLILHIHQANSYAYHSIKAIKQTKLKSKIILTTWGSDILRLPQQNFILKKMVQYNLRHAEIITSDSLFMSQQIKLLSPTVKQLHTINFGVSDFPTNIIDIDNKEDIILSNRLHKPLYNIDKIIIGFAKFIKSQQKYQHFKLIIAATGSDTPQLTQLVKDLGVINSVIFVGMISYEQLCSYLKIAKVFISIPNSDATSLSLLEAMAYGCYPIVSNIPANLEWVLDQINGTICQNDASLEINIVEALNKLEDKTIYDSIIRFNHDMIKQKAAYEENIKKFIDLYTKITLTY